MPDPIIGWRVWDAYADDGLLRSVFQTDIWPPGVRFDARCRRQGMIYLAGRECAEAPRTACCCGIYAVSDSENLEAFPRYTKEWSGQRRVAFEIVGTVSLWGRVIQHEDGYRAQHAYPYSLWVKPPTHGRHSRDTVELACSKLAMRLRQNYAVDVGVLR